MMAVPGIGVWSTMLLVGTMKPCMPYFLLSMTNWASTMAWLVEWATENHHGYIVTLKSNILGRNGTQDKF